MDHLCITNNTGRVGGGSVAKLPAIGCVFGYKLLMVNVGLGDTCVVGVEPAAVSSLFDC